MSDPRSHDFDALLAETGWVRRLARRLAGDPHLGDDLAQDAWVAALERPPRGDRPLGPWLAGILRHLTQKARRGDARRKGRERDAARADVAPCTDELVERAAVHRDLVEAVMALDEPYRTAILLRYLEELPPREIAARLDVPVRTVHTRLARGLEHLRRRLDRRHHGSWVAVLLSPLTRPPLPALTSTTGLLVMNAKWIQIAVVTVIVIALATVGAIEWLRPPAAKHIADTSPPRVSEKKGAALGSSSAEKPARSVVDDVDLIPSLLATPDLDRDLHGIVVTPKGEPIEGAALEVVFPVSRHVPGLVGWSEGRRTEAIEHTNSSGEFLIPLAPGRIYDLEVTAVGRARRKLTGLYAGEFVQVVLDPEGVLHGRVTVDEDSSPVAGALVSLSPGVVKDFGGPTYEARTNQKGEYRIHQLPAGYFDVDVEPPKNPWAYSQVVLSSGERRRLDLEVTRGATIRGRVTDGETKLPIAGASVGVGFTLRCRTTTDADGRYSLEGVHIGAPVDIHVKADGYGRWETQIFRVPEEGWTQDIFLLPGRTARGRIADLRGEAIAGAQVGATSRRHDYFLGSKLDGRYAQSDEQGSFELDGLRVDTRHTLVVRAEGFATAVFDFPASEWESPFIDFGEIALAPPGGMRGRLVDADGEPLSDLWVLLSAEVADRDRFGPAAHVDRGEGYTISEGFGTGRIGARTDARGRFCFADLPAGFYRLSAGAKGFARRGRLDVELDEGKLCDDLEIVLDLGLSIEGVIVDSDGSPVPKLPISVASGSSPDLSATILTGIVTYNLTRGDGSFFLRGLEPGTYDLSTFGGMSRDARGGRQQLGMTRWRGIEAGAKDLRLVVRRGTNIEGSIVDPHGKPVPGCSIYAVLDGVPQGNRLADHEGRFRIPLPEGTVADLVAWPSASPVLGTTHPILAEDGGMDESYIGRLEGVPAGATNVIVQLPRRLPDREDD